MPSQSRAPGKSAPTAFEIPLVTPLASRRVSRAASRTPPATRANRPLFSGTPGSGRAAATRNASEPRRRGLSASASGVCAYLATRRGRREIFPVRAGMWICGSAVGAAPAMMRPRRWNWNAAAARFPECQRGSATQVAAESVGLAHAGFSKQMEPLVRLTAARGSRLR